MQSGPAKKEKRNKFCASAARENTVALGWRTSRAEEKGKSPSSFQIFRKKKRRAMNPTSSSAYMKKSPVAPLIRAKDLWKKKKERMRENDRVGQIIRREAVPDLRTQRGKGAAPRRCTVLKKEKKGGRRPRPYYSGLLPAASRGPTCVEEKKKGTRIRKTG